MKYMPIEEFKERGYLQEANRLFFHPIGLALEVSIDGGEMKLSGIQDNRDDPEGMIFDNFDKEKADLIYDEILDKREARVKLECCSRLGIQVDDYKQ